MDNDRCTKRYIYTGDKEPDSSAVKERMTKIETEKERKIDRRREILLRSNISTTGAFNFLAFHATFSWTSDPNLIQVRLRLRTAFKNSPSTSPGRSSSGISRAVHFFRPFHHPTKNLPSGLRPSPRIISSRHTDPIACHVKREKIYRRNCNSSSSAGIQTTTVRFKHHLPVQDPGLLLETRSSLEFLLSNDVEAVLVDGLYKHCHVFLNPCIETVGGIQITYVRYLRLPKRRTSERCWNRCNIRLPIPASSRTNTHTNTEEPVLGDNSSDEDDFE